jgi:hypothetical protein
LGMALRWLDRPFLFPFTPLRLCASFLSSFSHRCISTPAFSLLGCLCASLFLPKIMKSRVTQATQRFQAAHPAATTLVRGHTLTDRIGVESNESQSILSSPSSSIAEGSPAPAPDAYLRCCPCRLDDQPCGR